MSAHLKVVPLDAGNVRDTATTLRRIADAVDEGLYGEVGSAALVILGDTMEVFAMGSDYDPCSAAALLQAGALRFAKAIEEHGRDV